MKKFESVDAFFAHVDPWRAEVNRLRNILLATGLEETFKWSLPCYVWTGKNVVGLGAFRSYFGLWFFQGALMDDPDGVLINAQQGKTKGMRQWRMTDKSDLKVRPIKKYVQLAIEVQASGREVRPERGKSIELHPIFAAELKRNRKAEQQFEALTAGRQREYANYVNEAKRDETKIRRVSKIIPMIENGVGLNDRYRS